MIFPIGGRRALAGIEASLIRSDPALAAQFDHFNRVAAKSAGRLRRRPRGRQAARKLAALLLLPLAAALALWAALSSGNGQSVRGCAAAVVCSPPRPACRATSGLAALGKTFQPCAAQPPASPH